MRVLAIRGRNLASLAGDFAIDFEAAPLGDAGIFAITGPTGAGKSTLLDAMCLALYNRVPRLRAAPKRGRVGSETDALSATDPRGLLRQGTIEGFAEIDFVGRDKARYRARWSVARARTGTLKQVDQALTSIDSGERIGGTRTETLVEIERRVGLTADQFGRAVMLAQGDFEAFIKAEADERAELLEQLTGTEIYSRLGIAAAAKAAGMREDIHLIQHRLDSQGGLSDNARATAEAQLAEVRTAQHAAKGALAALERDRDWYALLATLEARLVEAESGLANVRQDHAAAADRRLVLQRRRSAAGCIPKWCALVEIRGRANSVQGDLVGLVAAKTEAEGHASSLSAREALALEATSAARLALEAARPTLEAARSLDRQIAGAAQALAPLMEEGERLAAAAVSAATSHSTAVEDHAGCVEKRATVATWLEQAVARGPVTLRRDEIVADLTIFAKEETQLAILERRRGDAERNVVETSEASAAASDRLEHSEAQLATSQRQLAAAQAAAPVNSTLENLTKTRDAVAAVAPCLTALEAATGALTAADEAAQRVAHEIGQSQAACRAARGHAEQLAADLPNLRTHLQSAARAADLSNATADEAAAKLRSTLVLGEPCPVCGGTAHAVDALLGLIDARVDVDTKTRDDAERSVFNAEREAAVEADRIAAATARLERLEQQAGQATAMVVTAQAARELAVSALDEAAFKIGIEVKNIAHARGTVEERLAAIDEQRQTATAALAVLDLARGEADRARDLQDAASSDSRLKAEASRQAVQALHAIMTGVEAVHRDIGRLSISLEQRLMPLFDWRDEREPIARLDALVAEWLDHRQLLEAADAVLPALLQRVQTTEITKVRAADAAEQATRAAEQAGKSHDALVVERAKLLGGEASEFAAARFEAAVSAASAVADRAGAEAEAARIVLVTLTAQTEACKQQVQASAGLVEKQSRELINDLERLQLTEAEVEFESSVPASALEKEAQALSELDDRVTTAASAAATRGGDVRTHKESSPPRTTRDELAGSLADAVSVEAGASEAASEAEAVIRQDDRARLQAATIRQSLEEAREAAQIWFRLDELIGDREGRKFRRFAQGLTLDRLIFHANIRLAELQPRYTLERRQDGEMLIQVVDNDLGGQVRGLHNLSGGERFLVSLALALGLSEMSTGQGLSIESLFIDEGFGALDSASLAQAISMLEGLHATGRRVGVISHIEEVKERIPVKIVVSPVARGRSEVTVEATS